MTHESVNGSTALSANEIACLLSKAWAQVKVLDDYWPVELLVIM